jgi:general transcription factor 3C polypeptide 5 (transcription factor C subunit 1)
MAKYSPHFFWQQTKSIKLINRSKQKRTPIVSATCNDAIPLCPTPEILQVIPTIPSRILEAIQQKYSERPIWTRLALSNELNDPTIIKSLKQALPTIAYYVTSGPWKMTWIKFGVDPKSDSKYRFYQALDTRNQFKVGWLRAKPKFTLQKTEKQMDVFRSHIFDGKDILESTSLFQMCDLLDPILKELVDTKEFLRDECHVSHYVFDH